MAVRFLSPRVPALELPGVPATFVDGVADLTDPGQISRMRYLGAPYGVREVGAVDPGVPLTVLPTWDERPAAAIDGLCGVNTVTGAFEWYSNGGWHAVTG